MSFHEYVTARDLVAQDVPFYALIQAAMRKADNMNETKLRSMYPTVWDELQARYDAPGGLLEGEQR